MDACLNCSRMLYFPGAYLLTYFSSQPRVFDPDCSHDAPSSGRSGSHSLSVILGQASIAPSMVWEPMGGVWQRTDCEWGT